MILRNVSLNSETFLHLERYVNGGSPSGFTDMYTTSPNTSAKGSAKSFFLCAPQLPDLVPVEDFGDQPEFFNKWQMLVHPDMIADPLFSECINVDHEALLVSPTASSRTVRIADDDGWFLKLNYKGLIGRIDRQIGLHHAQSAIEVSAIISDAIDAGLLPNNCYLLREVFARVVKLQHGTDTYDWGIVLREPTPFPHDPSTALLVPGFSLFTTDDKMPDDPTLLVQLVENQAKDVEDFLFDELLAPLFEAYFTILLRCGLQLEAHGQNVLYALDKDLHVRGVVLRDAESIDKDVSLVEDLGLGTTFREMEYKTLVRGQYNYQIMHSFMFDFKLGEYLAAPLIDEASRKFGLDPLQLDDRVRDLTRSYIAQLPDDFFPTGGEWYSYADVVHDRTVRREYIATPNPRFR